MKQFVSNPTESSQQSACTRRQRWRRRCRALAPLTGIFLIFNGCRQNSNTETAKNAPLFESCPLRTNEQWQDFISEAGNKDEWLETCEDSTCDEEFYEYVATDIQNIVDKCQAYLVAHPHIAKCSNNLRRFTKSWMAQHDSVSYGFAVDNHTYLLRQTAPGRPSKMMIPPPEIISALPLRSQVEKTARENGLAYLTHDSALGGIRTYIFNPDPEGRFDQWVLLNLQKGGPGIDKATPVSVVGVERRDATGKPLDHVKVEFRDYTLLKDKGGKYRLTLNESNNGKCYSCHANGVRQLIARHTPVLDALPVKGDPGFNQDEKQDSGHNTEFAYQRLLAFNRRLRSYGGPNWDGNIIVSDHGPVLGAKQGCVECHNGDTRGTLNISTSTSQLKRRIFEDLTMPPTPSSQIFLEHEQLGIRNVYPKEAAALAKMRDAHSKILSSYEQDRLPNLRAWLLQDSCLEVTP